MEYRQLIKSGKLLMYKITFKNTRNITAKLDKNNEVIVTCPEYIDFKLVDSFVELNFDKFYNFIKNKEENSLINWSENKIGINGISHKIKIEIVEKKERYEIIGNNIYLFLKKEENKKKIINKMLTELGSQYLINRTNMWLKKFNQKAYSIDTKWYESKWGQCEYRSMSIVLAIQLYMLNNELIDYVIIHEICHLIIPDHSNKFWKLVEQRYPNYKIAKEKLKYEC